MEVTGFLTAIGITLVIGVLGRLIARASRTDTEGIDWIELALQVGLAAGVALVAGTRGRRRG